MEFGYTAEQIALKMECQKFAKEEIAENVRLLEEDLFVRQRLFEKMGQKGFFTLGLMLAEKKRDPFRLAIALKEISKVDAGIGVTMAVTNMVAEAIEWYGSKQQQAKYLSAIKQGESVPASFALTEEQAGSDPKNIQTRAEVDLNNSDYFWINGSKRLITNGDLSGVLIVFAKTTEGISAFLIERGTPGMEVSKTEQKLGLLTANLVGLSFDKCRVHRNQLLGKLGEGLKIALGSLDSGRIGVAAQAIGIAEASYEAALHYSQVREQFGKKICENQAIAFELADMHVKLSAAKLLLSKACWQRVQGISYTLAASEAKLYASEIANEIASEAMQIFGGYGYIKDYPLERYFRDARATTLYEGTSEIQRLVISRSILKEALIDQ
ncbi:MULTISPECIES: acyl-CoA dehydrogenase family protein [Parachlamydia]|jgi:alkylation response protein AidB-like acyl-CoA dehydrogenase|uniref:acyl-CoA dehydrogenase family protein n=1 Tax=Parachlamydia TaxID=83551 RepID=UPI0001C172CB|nr:acyl-CoA dehydrogenase family protein [Parachlamydia acanthamoebae]EFB40490.1 hypothetical protein pah_c200o039 [Parachlamydia acanthamoebae str. Hall's coccus]